MAGTPEDWNDWYRAAGHRLADLAAEGPGIRTARLQARLLHLAARMPEEMLAAWLALGERLESDGRAPGARKSPDCTALPESRDRLAG